MLSREESKAGGEWRLRKGGRTDRQEGPPARAGEGRMSPDGACRIETASELCPAAKHAPDLKSLLGLYPLSGWHLLPSDILTACFLILGASDQRSSHQKGFPQPPLK